MKRIFLIILFIFLMPTNLWAACTGSSPTWTSTPDYASVNTCVSLASPEDTINISAGSQTWNSTLSINKGINLIGAGIGNTTISGTVRPLIWYAPSSGNATHNYAFRVSGFTFDLSGSGQAIYLSSGNSTTLQTKVRIDHNRFYNSSFDGSAVEGEGMRGVIDSNTMENLAYPLQIGWGDKGTGDFWWANFPELAFGTAENMYVEDNTFTGVGATAGVLENADTGGRYAFRYNTVYASDQIFDLHGPQSGAGRSAFGGEVYGNNIVTLGGSFVNQRGARMLVFYNNKGASGGYWSNTIECDGNYVYSGEQMNNSYYFINRAAMTGELTAYWEYERPGGPYNWFVQQNVNYWVDNTSCEAPNTCSNITSGVGCGTFANRPTSCTTGTGYWATNQSCSDLTGMVGSAPTIPISGTLYKCVSTNTWAVYFTPYTYPHPLRTGPSLLIITNLHIRD